MALSVSLRWQNPDSTLDLNNKVRYVVERGLLWGGNVAPGVGLSVTVDPLVAQSYDGMAVFSGAIETLTVAAGQTNVVLIYAKYSASGPPTLVLQVLDDVTYNAHPDKDYMIVLAKITLAPLAVSVTLSDIDFTQRDEVDQVGRLFIRGTTVYANLPTPTSPTNRVGDMYYVTDHQVFYVWDGSTWEALNTGSYNTETVTLNNEVIEGQRNRNLEGSGVLSGARPGDGSFASDPQVDPLETPSVADQIGLDAFSAIINGHYVEPYARNITLSAKPGGGSRYDLIFLEVYRVNVVTPETFQYDRNPDGTLNYSINQVDDEEEQISWVKGTGGNNWNMNELASYNHTWRGVTYRFASISNVPAVALHNPNDASVVSLATNIDGVNFSAPPAGSDDRAWIATSAITPVDGRSWAIPLFVIRRESTEDHTTNNAIKVFRSGVRHVFPVYPVCDTSNAAREAVDTLHRLEPTNHDDSTKVTYEDPSGFITAMDFPVQAGAGANTIAFFDEGAKIRVRGNEDWLTLASADIDLGTPPGVGWTRVLVYLEMTITLYADDPATKSYYMVSPTHRPLIPSRLGAAFRSQGWKRGYVNYEVIVHDLGSNDYRDEHDAMVAAGWSRGDATQPTNHQFDDGGIWSQVITATDDDRCHPYLAKWAIPICLVHRRNSAAWAYGTNENGTGVTRPDARQDATVLHPDDMVDLRHLVDFDPNSYKELIEESLDKNMKGQLRTRLANKYLGSAASINGSVAGSRILQTDMIGNSGGAAYDLTPPDGYRKIWSDAKELHVVGINFDIASSSSDPNLFDYAVSGSVGTLVIKAPPNSHLVRHIPGVCYTEGDTTSPSTYMDFYGPPCWTTQVQGAVALSGKPNPVLAKYIDASAQEQNVPFWMYNSPGVTSAPSLYNPFKVTAKDAYGRATQMRGYVDLSGAPTGTVSLTWWVHYDRTFAAPYDVNYGLAEIPDEVHQAWRDPLGTPVQLNVGPIYVAVRKTVAPGGTSATFSAADVSTNSGLSGTVQLLGLDYQQLAWSNTPPTVTSITMNDAQTSITINFGAWGPGGDVEALIFFETSDVSEWIEVGRGGKSVQALYSWGSDPVDIGAVPPSDWARNIKDAVWSQVEVAGRRSISFPFIWTRAVPATTWTLSLNHSSDYENSNMFSFSTSVPSALSRYNLLVYPVLNPLNAAVPADYILLHYTYTPYQGLSSDGGKAATVGTAVPLLQNMLHGEIEANSDFYASQSGACSYHSGVDSFTGISINHTHPFHGTTLPIMGGRFGDYNRSFTVKPPNLTRGVLEMSSKALSRQFLNAAAVLRMPFPLNFNMVGASTYHEGVMDFDLDPARAGAGAGCWSYAPGYVGGPVTELSPIRYDQFVNGLSRLATKGESHRQEEGLLITTDMYESERSTGTITNNGYRWTVAGTNVLWLDASMRNRASALVTRSVTQCDIDRTLGVGTNVGWYLYSAEQKNFEAQTGPTDPAFFAIDSAGAVAQASIMSTLTPPTNVKLNFCVCAGTIHQYYKLLDQSSTPILVLRAAPLGGSTAEILDTSVTIDSEYFLHKGARIHVSKVVDLIQVPFDSYQYTYRNGREFALGMTSLSGIKVQYPSNWSAGDITAAEGLLVASVDLRGAGRGLYLGSNETRYNMPVFLPGTGNELSEVLRDQDTMLTPNADASPRFPYMPGDPLFASSNKHYYDVDHGGPIAYVFFGAIINPENDDYKNRAVLQISGGPVGLKAESSPVHADNDLDGTAIDAFWPIGRPLLPTRR
jgi:hypothetical protein